MAGSKSNAFENLFLNHVFGNVALAAPGTVYIGLWTAELDDASTGETAGECSYTSYARVATVPGTAGWTAAAGGTVKNAAAVTFPTATGDQAGTITHWAALNASAAGTILYHDDLTTSKTVASGDTPRFAIDALVITED